MGEIQRFGLPKQGGVPASQAVMADGWLFVAGQVPKNAEGEFVVGGIAEQVWLDDPRDFAIFNRVYSRYFTLEHAPARVTVQAHMMNDFKVEIDCVAWKAPR